MEYLRPELKDEEFSRSVIDSNNKFAVDIYKICSSSSDRNIVMSPLSISISLASNFMGSEGRTKSHVAKLLYYTDIPLIDIHRTFSRIVEHMKSSTVYKSHIGSELFIDDSFKILDEYKTKMQQYYNKSQCRRLNFRDNPAISTLAINNWVSDNTNGKIDQTISEHDIDESVKFILVNVIYI